MKAGEVQVVTFLENYEHEFTTQDSAYPNSPWPNTNYLMPINYQGIKHIIITSLLISIISSHRPTFCAHLPFFGGSLISNVDVNFSLPFAFSTSKLRTLGVSGISSNFVARPLLFCTSFGNVDLLGVRAVATLRADLRRVLRTSQERFLARYQSTEDATILC